MHNKCMGLYGNLAMIAYTARDYQGKRVNRPYRPYTQGNPSKLILDMVSSYSAYATRALRGFFRGGPVYVSFRQSKGTTPTPWEVSFDILITSKNSDSHHV